MDARRANDLGQRDIEEVLEATLEVAKTFEEIRLQPAADSLRRDARSNTYALLHEAVGRFTRYPSVNQKFIGPIRPYFEYLDVLAAGGTTLEQLVDELRGAHELNLVERSSLAEAECRHPLVGIFARHLLEQQDSANRLERGPFEWYKELLADLDALSGHQGRFFAGLRRRAPSGRFREEEKNDFLSFVDDFEADLQGFSAGILQVGSQLGCHLQKEDCAVCMLATPHAVPNHEIGRFKEQLARLMNEGMFSRPDFKRFFPGVTAKEGIAWIPNLVSVVDIARFTKFYCTFVSRLADMAEGRQSRCGKGARGFSRRHEDQSGQARISFDVPGDPAFNDFSIRIDNELRGVTLDIGGIRAQRALDHALHLAKKGEDAETVVSYGRIVTEEGALSRVQDDADRYPRQQTHPYASAMLDYQLSPGERAALVAAGILQMSQGVTYPYPTTAFAYHLRGKLNQPRHAAAFPAIAQTFRTFMR